MVHIVYPIHELCFGFQALVLRRAFELSFDWWLDEFDPGVCVVGRRVVGVSFEDAFSYFEDGVLPVMVLRRFDGVSERVVFEVGFRVVGFISVLVLVILVDCGDVGGDVVELVEFYEGLGGVVGGVVG